MGEWVAEVRHAHHNVVIRTPPGCAHVVADLEALGEEAIILSNRNVSSGVEILAVAEDDMASIVGTPPAAARR